MGILEGGRRALALSIARSETVEKEKALVLSGSRHSSVDSNHERGEEEAVRGRLVGWDARQSVVTTAEGVSAKDGRACERL